MILEPINDAACLGKLSRLALSRSGSDAFEALGQEFADTDQLRDHLRTLPQRNDEGDPSDGPRIDCGDVSQRVRQLPGDPNCFERSAMYLALAEHVDPATPRQLATVSVPGYGAHTFPVENVDGFVRPDNIVILDPTTPAGRNALSAALTRNNFAVEVLRPIQILAWILQLAKEPAEDSGNVPRVRNGARQIRELLRKGRPFDTPRDVGYTLALARREAEMWGDSTAAHVDGIARNFRVFGQNVRLNTKVIKGAAKALGRFGGRFAGPAFRAWLATKGVPPSFINQLDRDLRKEGLSLGPLAQRSNLSTMTLGGGHFG